MISPNKITNFINIRNCYQFLNSNFPGGSPASGEKLFMDASWYNSNFWLRYSLLRQGAGLGKYNEIACVDEYCKIQNSITLHQFGVKRKHRYSESKKSRKIADALFRSIRTKEDIFKVEFPDELPAKLFYDYALKRQKNAFVTVGTSEFEKNLRSYIAYSENAKTYLDESSPSIAVTSHAVSQYAPFVWQALLRKLDVLIPCGDFGMNRFWRIKNKDQIYDYMDKPRFEVFENLTISQQSYFEKKGKDYLEARFGGKTTDISADYVYKRRRNKVTRDEICQELGFDKSKPIVTIYFANWFDFPHTFGMDNFIDFYDWTIETLKVITKNKNVNWLLRSHPIDEWYGGPNIRQMAKDYISSHIKICPTDWDSTSVMASSDGIISYHGTIGLEATSMGIPVMNVDRGWYHDWKFTLTCNSKKEYLENLLREWWHSFDRLENQRRARCLTGAFFGRPDWQKNLILEDDSKQDSLLTSIPDFVRNNKEEIDLELKHIEGWWQSGESHFHSFKMMSEARKH